jgi:hypothetical protein
MGGFTLNPISDPDDIRREAAANTPNSPIAAQQERIDEIQADIDKVDHATDTAAPSSESAVDATVAMSPNTNPPSVDAPLAVGETPDVTMQSSVPPQPETMAATNSEQPSPQADAVAEQPIVAFTSADTAAALPASMATPTSFDPSSVYPSPMHEAKLAEKLDGTQTYSYSYKLPVGVYIIAAFSIQIAVFLWVCVAFFDARSWQIIVQALIFSAGGAGLLKGIDVVRWLAVSAASVGTLYYGYYFFKSLQGYLKYSDELFGMLSPLIMGGMILYGIAILYLAVSALYLMRPGVARAFR